jgi:sphingomyelin phosphodiesterase acid-like 3
MSARILLSAFLFLLVGNLHPACAAGEGKTGECLVISDIHFDPFADPTLFEALAKRPVSEWSQLFDSSLGNGVSQLGSDTNYVLLKSCLAAAVERCPRPDFILFPGDSLAHNWKARYEKTAARSRDDDLQAYQNFTAKTVEFLAREIRKHFPDAPILPALGNEDAYCGDYEVQPDGPFLEMFARAWLDLPGPIVDKGAFAANFARGGHYSVRIPPLFRHRIIVVNSVFFSDQYENSCGSKLENPGKDEIAWLAASLDEASRAGEKVWLMMHIPVGINDYNTVQDEEAGTSPAEFWEPAYTGQFVTLVRKYRQIVQFVFAGHTHMDDFRIIRDAQMPLAVNKLVPAISPIFRNNPGFQIYQYNRLSGSVRNYQTYYLSNLSTAGAPTRLEHLKWQLEYDFLAAYGQKALDISAVTSIAEGLKASGSMQDLYMRFYAVSAPSAFDKLLLPAYSCAILHTSLQEFENCQKADDIGSVRYPVEPPSSPDETK